MCISSQSLFISPAATEPEQVARIMLRIINAMGKTITVSNTCISVSAPGNTCYVTKLTHNKSNVIAINKTCISTCNADMLVSAIERDNDIAANVIGYVTRINPAAIGYKLTKSAFYVSFTGHIVDWLDFFRNAQHSTRQLVLSDHICYQHEAKMHGVISLSTYVGMNEYCKARCNNCDNAICKYCYANSLTKQRDGLKNKLIRVHAILTNIRLCAADIPVLDAEIYPYFRIEAFGDLNNALQMYNYNLLSRMNSGINFTLWTKNPGIIQSAINAGMTLSDNLVIGLSSLYLNTPEIEKAKRYSFVRFLFTVYDDDYIAEHNIVINCGAKHCISCGICYKYLHEYNNGLMIINERKK